MNHRLFLAGLLLPLALAGCANKPGNESSLKTSFAAEEPHRKPLKAHDPIDMEPTKWAYADLDAAPIASLDGVHHLAGRTLEVASLHDLKLADKEVVLTFDDGPAPGKTERVLAALDKFGVKATFMMVGEMAEAHAATALKVLADGDTIGSHTYRHPDLDKMSFDMAMAEIEHGRHAVSKVLGVEPSFFRFPYLADSKRLRAAVASRDLVTMDVDIDTKDYFNTTPAAVVQRTMAQLEKRRRGIILMHDIHQRTAAMLPTLLTRLEKEGYKVVTLKYKGPAAPPSELVAQADIRFTR
jgi:peptidoglycan/xylan/chitin deacetylase (PgdA/CDA1 family)